MAFNGTLIVTIKPHFFGRSKQSYFINFKRRAMKVKVSVFIYFIFYEAVSKGSDLGAIYFSIG